MSVFVEGAENLYVRTVRMRVTDWDKFCSAFVWLMEQTRGTPGCVSIICYRSSKDPALVSIVEYWDSPTAIETAYEKAGELPWQMWERAGKPEYIEDLLWERSDIDVVALAGEEGS
jgi:hypothetical protein